ncbi:MAG TPA: zf-TFIIB domain-containing protein [Acidimicrobiales bacterium]
MQCPVCDVTLSISSREGIEIDFCPQCRGVWLDRGELDKIIERAAPPAVPPGRGYDEPRRAPEPRYEEPRRYDDDRSHKRKRRGSFLEDLFDFD